MEGGVIEKLLPISPATMDRLLSEERRRLEIRVSIKAYDPAVGFGVVHVQDMWGPGYFGEWPVEDPAEEGIERFRAVRDELRSKIDLLLEELSERRIEPSFSRRLKRELSA